VGFKQRGALGEKLLKERFPYQKYSLDISGREIDREIKKLREEKLRTKTQAEKNTLAQNMARLEEAKKRAGL